MAPIFLLWNLNFKMVVVSFCARYSQNIGAIFYVSPNYKSYQWYRLKFQHWPNKTHPTIQLILLLSSVCVYGGGDRKQQMKVCTGMLLSSIWFEVCLSGLNMHLFFRWRWNNHSHSWTIEWSHWSQLYRSWVCNLPCLGWSRQNVGHGFRASN